MRKHVLRTLGLSLMAALGLVALFASTASAADLTVPIHGKLLVLGSEDLTAGVTGKLGLGQLLVAGLSIEIHCVKGTVVSASITEPLLGEGLGIFLFEECKVYPINPATGVLTSAEPLACNIINGGENRHITAIAKIRVVQHEGVKYLLAELEKEIEIEFKSGEGCPIPLKPKIKGTYAFEVTQAHQEVLTITAGLEPLQKLLGDKLLYGTNVGIIHGTGTAQLTGVHEKCTWGVV